MLRAGTLRLILFSLLISITTQAQEGPDIFIKNIDLPNLRWGEHTAEFQAVNKTGYLKFLAVVAEVEFSQSYLAPKRARKSFHILYPEDSLDISAPVEIPGNYGQAKIVIKIYDVVDTADVLLEDQKFYEQPFQIRYSIPEAIARYFAEKITMPPMVEVHPRFDNEFARVLPYLIAEGKSVAQIAELAKADESFVAGVVNDFIANGYLKENNGSYEMLFPAVTLAEAELARELSERMSDKLTSIFIDNMPDYKKTLSNMVATGAVSADSNEFLNGGTILYRLYPTIAVLTLWHNLGHQFVTNGGSLVIYSGTDLCNTHIPRYMYAVQGGDLFNGTNFYHHYVGRASYSIFYGDNIPIFDCEEDFAAKYERGNKSRWFYRPEYKPDDFMFDTTIIKPAIDALTDGSDSLLVDTYLELQGIAKKFGRNNVSLGQRYWFWNLTATRTLRKLTEAGLIEPTGNGQFRLRGM